MLGKYPKKLDIRPKYQNKYHKFDILLDVTNYDIWGDIIIIKCHNFEPCNVRSLI